MNAVLDTQGMLTFKKNNEMFFKLWANIAYKTVHHWQDAMPSEVLHTGVSQIFERRDIVLSNQIPARGSTPFN